MAPVRILDFSLLQIIEELRVITHILLIIVVIIIIFYCCFLRTMLADGI